MLAPFAMQVSVSASGNGSLLWAWVLIKLSTLGCSRLSEVSRYLVGDCGKGCAAEMQDNSLMPKAV